MTFGKKKKTQFRTDVLAGVVYSASMYADLVGELDQQMQEKVHRKSNGFDNFDSFVNDVIRTPRSTTRTPFVCVCVWKMDLSRLGNVLSVMISAMAV